MKKVLVPALAVVAALAFANSTAGALFSDDFEAYTVGSNLHGQGGWAGWDNDPAAGAPVSDAYAFSGTKSVEIGGPDTDLVQMFAGATSGQWMFDAMQYIPSGGSGNNFFIMLSEYTHDPNVARTWAPQIQFNVGNGAISGQDRAAAASGEITFDTWVPLRVDVDLDTNRYSAFYGDQTLLSDAIWTMGALRQIEALDLYGNDASPVYYDDVSLAAVPVLTWDNHSGSGKWSDANWTNPSPPPPPPDWPDETISAVIEETGLLGIGAPVTVADADASAFSLKMSGVGDWSHLIIGTGRTLTVRSELDAGEGSNLIQMAPDAKLSTGYRSGELFGLWTEGDATIDTGGSFGVVFFSDEDAGPTGARTLTKQGVGTLSLDNTGVTGEVVATHTTFRIEEGTLALAGAAPLGGSTAPVELAGGTARFVEGRMLPPGAIAYYAFNDADDVGYDGSGNGMHGAPSGDPTFEPAGKSGGALRFDGDDGLSLENAPFLEDDFNARTVSFWMYQEDTTGDQMIFDEGGSTDCIGIGTAEGVLQARIKFGSEVTDIIDVAAPAPGWHHVAAVFDGQASTFALYLDTVVVGGAASPTAFSAIDAHTDDPGLAYVNAANDLGGDPFKGLLDEAVIYDRALDADGVLALYQAGSYVPGPLVLATADFAVSADSGIDVTSYPSASFRTLTLEEGIVTLSGGADGITFTGGINVPQYTSGPIPDGRIVGLNLMTEVTGPINANSSTATILKQGPVDLVLEAGNTGLDQATIAPMGGRIVSVMSTGVNPLGGATVEFLAPEPLALVGQYTFEDPGNLGKDTSGNEMHGTPVGDPGPAAVAGLNGTTWALGLDGVDAGLNLNNPIPGPDFLEAAAIARTVDLWFEQSGDPGASDGAQMIYEEGGATNGFAIQVVDGVLQARVKAGDSVADIVDSGPLAAGPHHVVATFGDSEFNLSLDGSPIGTVPAFVEIPDHSNDPGLGYQNDESAYGGAGGYFNGAIDEVNIYGRDSVGAGEVVICSGDVPATDIDFTTPIVVNSRGTLTAGDDEHGQLGPAAVRLSDVTLNHILTLNAPDLGGDGDPSNDYRFVLTQALDALGGLEIIAGEVEFQKAVKLGTLHVNGGWIVQTGDAGLGEQDITVTDSVELITDSLNVTGNTVPFLTEQTNVVVGSGQILTMNTAFDAESLELGGAVTPDPPDPPVPAAVLDLVGPKDVTVRTDLTLGTGAVVDTTGATLTTDGAAVNVNGGSLSFSNSLSAASVAVNDGTLTAGADVSVDGAVSVSAGTVVVPGAVTAASVTVSGGDVAVGGALTAPDVTFSGGTADVTGTVTAANVTVSGGSSTLGGMATDDMTVSGGSLDATGPMSAATATVSGGGLNLAAGADLSVDTMTIGGGATVDTREGQVIVASELNVGSPVRVTYGITGGSFRATGSDLSDHSAPRNLILSGGNLSIDFDVALPTDPFAYWKLDEDAGATTVLDSSPSGYDGVFNGATPGEPGVIGNACSFDGDDDWVQFEPNDDENAIPEMHNTDYLTVAMWFNRRTEDPSPNDPTTNHNINNVLIAQSSDAGNDNLEIGTQGDDVELYVDTDGTDSFAATIPDGIANNTWHHIVMTYDMDASQELKLYFNGEFIEDWGSPSGDIRPGNEAPLTLGVARPDSSDPWGEFDGLIDELYLFYRALGLDEIQALYLAPTVGGTLNSPATNLVVTADTEVTLNTPDNNLGALVLENNAIATFTAGPTTISVGELAGVGTVVSDVLSVSGTLSPGDGVGALDVAGNLGLEAGAVYEWEMGPGAGPPTFAADRVDVSDNLAFDPTTGWTLRLLDPGAPEGNVGTDQVLYTYGTVSGFDPAKVTIDYSEVPHWRFTGGTGEVVDDLSGQILLRGLEKVLGNFWINTDGGSYWDADNWLKTVAPEGPGASASFLNKIETASTVTLGDTPLTLGTIDFDSPSPNNYTIEGPAGITLDASGVDAEINVFRGEHAIRALLSLADGLTVNAADGAVLRIEPPAGFSSLEGAVTKKGAGSLILGPQLLVVGPLNVNEGVLEAGKDVLARATTGGPPRVITLGATATLKASGYVNGLVIDAGGLMSPSTLQAIGPMFVGQLDRTDGYNYAGILNADTYSVVLLDDDKADVGIALIAGGSLTGAKGIQLNPAGVGFGGFITGSGAIHGVVTAGTPGNPAMGFGGMPPGITIYGDVIGLWNQFDNTTVTGMLHAGFSPAHNPLGPGSNAGTAQFLIGGPLDGEVTFNSEKGEYEKTTGDHTQFLVYGVAEGVGAPTVFESLELKLDEDYPDFGWNDLAAGDDIVLIQTAPWQTVQFITLPFPHYETTLVGPGQVEYGSSFEGDLESALDLIRPKLATGLDVTYTMNPGGLALHIVPEPGTLALLLSGGLALLVLAYAWRRKNAV